MVDRKCSKCGEDKPGDMFTKGRAQCKPCRDIYHAEYRAKNKIRQKKYRDENPEKIAESNRKFRSIEGNKSKYREYRRNWQKDRLDKDPAFKLRRNVSRLINFKINKNSKSSFKYLPYTVQELKDNLESKFEDWMSWDNWGKYSVSSWDDNDKSTWTWQIDHITCQADLPYDSMEHVNFKKCWALKNLRPYSSKDNLIDGVTGVRHNKKGVNG